MRHRIALLWRHHKWLLLAFVLAALLSVMFAVRTVVFTLYWANPAHERQPLQDWMTLRYVAYSWHVPRQDLARTLGLEPPLRPGLTIAEIERRTGLKRAEIAARLSTLSQTRERGQ